MFLEWMTYKNNELETLCLFKILMISIEREFRLPVSVGKALWWESVTPFVPLQFKRIGSWPSAHPCFFEDIPSSRFYFLFSGKDKSKKSFSDILRVFGNDRSARNLKISLLFQSVLWTCGSIIWKTSKGHLRIPH